MSDENLNIPTEQPTEIPVEPKESKKIVIDFPVFKKAENWVNGNITISLPSEVYKQTAAAINSVPNVSIVNTQEDREWARVARDGLDLNTVEEILVGSLNRGNGHWRQALEVNGDKLIPKAPGFKETSNTELKGERGKLRVLSQLGIGTLFQVPLYHTGIWVTFKAPTEGYLLELNRLILSDKIRFGRNTYGLAFSNTSSYTTDRLVSAALEHVYDTSLDITGSGVSSLKDIISSQDIPSLLWGFACTMFPKGFQYERACLADPEKCNHVEREVVNITKLQFVDTSELTDWQKAHMSVRRPNSKSIESIRRYQEELLISAKRKVSVNKNTDNVLQLTLKVPTISEYIDAGYRWISDITAIVESSLTADSQEDKDIIITRHGQATSMRQYVHWVEKIELSDDNYITAKETIEEVFDSISSDDKIRNEFIDEVVKYIDHTNICLIGIPNYECGSCGKEQPVFHDLDNFKSILPLDLIPLFFELLVQKLQRLKDR